MAKVISLFIILFFFQIQPAYSGFWDWLIGDDIPHKGLSYESEIHFDPNKYERLAKNSKERLDRIGKRLIEIQTELDKKNIEMHLLVEAHTDDTGPPECNKLDDDEKWKCIAKYNNALSYNRAVTVVNYLKNHFSFTLIKMTPRGMGYKNPKVTGKRAYSEKGRWKNRRVRIVVTEVIRIRKSL